MKARRPGTKIACAAALIVCAALPAWPADAQRAPEPPAGIRSAGPDTVTLNFANADIEGVVKAMSEITGKNFVIDPRVRGTINIVSTTPVPRSLVYDVFLSALRLQGVAAIEERGIVKIVPESDAKLHQTPTFGPQDKARSSGDQIQTRVYTLQHESAAQLVAVLRPLIAPNNTIAAYPATNSLIVTDYASNLRRIEKIIESIDRPSGSDLVVIPLKHASAPDVAQTVNRVFAESAPAQGAAPADPSQRYTVVADLRSNSLLVRAGDPARLQRLRSLIATLDSPTSAAGNIHVIYLKNADAVKLAETLRGAYSGAPPPQQRSTLVAPPPPPPGTAPPGTAQPAAASALANAIHADPATNSIIINAPDAIYNDLRAAVEKLDVRRAQVYVEALVAEVTAQKAAEFGIQWQDLSGAGADSTRVFGGTNFGTPDQNIIGLSQNPLGAGRGLNIGVIRGRVSIPGVNAQVLNLGLLVRALESDNNANILSTPTLLTLDNEEARIVVGQNVPFITGQYAVSGAATTPTPFQTIERRDVGLTLRIKPQISEGGTVRMQIMQEVSSVQSFTNVAGIITNKRSVESTVLLDDGEIIVIGGLIQDTVNDGIEKVPVLGDLPLLGGLFQYRTRSRSKTNLMVFLRPTVLRDPQRAGPLSAERYDYIIGEQQKVQPAPHPALPDIQSPTLPLRSSPELRSR